MADRLDLPRRYRRTVEALLREHVPDVEVWAYGSRVNGGSHEASDLDLVLRGPRLEPMDSRFPDLLEAIEQSNIPILVQAQDWTGLPESFHREIERDYVVVQEGAQQTTAGEWRVATIDDIAEKVAMGPFGSSIKVETFVPKGVPIISGQHLHGFRVDDSSGYNFISREHAQRLANANVSRGDIVLTHRGTIGQVAYVPKKSKYRQYVISQSQFYIRCDSSKALPEFVTMYFKSPEGQHRLLANRSQVGVPSIAQPVTYLRTVEIPLPPLAEQRAIAHVLGTLDDKIELNRRMNDTLEAMARALFKSWFVDFEPVRAKMEGRWQKGESLPGLPEHYDLFPDRVVDSELGPIPEGWEVKALGECYDLIMGQSPPGNTYNDSGNGTPFFQGSTDFGERYPANRRYCTKPARLAQFEDTLVSVRAPVGAINRAWERCCIGRGVAALRHKSGSASYTYYAIWATQPEIGQYEHTGTVFGAIGGQQLKALQVLEPPEGVIAEFHRIGEDVDSLIRSNVEESRALAAQRDALLPRLVSGKVQAISSTNA